MTPSASLRIAAVSLLVLSASAIATDAFAQSRREGGPMILRVQPRSFLDAGRVAPVGSMNRYATQSHSSHVVSPPFGNVGEFYGDANRPDPISGTFIGARNPFAPVDFTGTLPR